MLNKHYITTLCLGFFSGLPLALSGATLQAWYADNNVSLVAIGFLTLVGIPYTYKFLWAPFLDRYRAPCFSFFSRRKSWILLMQLTLFVLIMFMSMLSPLHHGILLGGIALVIALASSTQDVAIDAYRTELLLPQERGLGSAAFIFTYRLAMLASGGLSLILVDHIGWPMTIRVIAVFFLLGMLMTSVMPRVTESIDCEGSMLDLFFHPLRAFLEKKGALWILLFVVLYKIGDAFALSLTTTFLLRGVHFSLSDIGLMYKTLGLMSMVVGSFLGGWLLQYMPLLRALLIFGCLQAASNLLFAELAYMGHDMTMGMIAVIGELFCGGLATAAFLAFLMSVCDLRYTATQFALLSALSAVGRVFIGPIAGELASRLGWVDFYILSFLVSLPGLVVLLPLMGIEMHHEAKEVP